MKRCGACAFVLFVMSVGCGSDPAPAAGSAGSGGGGSPAATTGTSGTSTGSTATGGSTGAGGSSGGAGGSACGGGPLPEGNCGIAAKHPGDVGIETDPDVVFADNFETYAQARDLGQKWDAVYQMQDVRIATESGNFVGGAKGLEFTVPQMMNELSNATDKVLTQERDVLFLRYYSKFQPPYDVV